MQKNQIIEFKDLIPLRPFKGGFSPDKYKFLLGKKLKKSVKKFTLITKNNLMQKHNLAILLWADLILEFYKILLKDAN